MRYAGIISLMHLIKEIKKNQDLGHPMCNNIREGDWLIKYTIER